MWPFKRSKVEKQGAVALSGPAEPVNLPAKPLAKHQTAADVLDYHVQKAGAEYSRRRDPKSGKVRILVTMPTGDVFAGNGLTTLEAVHEVVAKMEAGK